MPNLQKMLIQQNTAVCLG